MLYNILAWFWYLVLAGILTYLVVGFIVGFEVVLAMSGSKWASDWIKSHHSYQLLYYEVILFYPMILLSYLFLELIPHYVFREPTLAPFDMQGLFDRLFKGK